jgi:hypothetical protein
MHWRCFGLLKCWWKYIETHSPFVGMARPIQDTVRLFLVDGIQQLSEGLTYQKVDVTHDGNFRPRLTDILEIA